MAVDELQVTLNGEIRALPPGTTVSQLLAEIAPAATAPSATAQRGRCAVEVNRAIVPRSRHAEHALQDGDVIEIVTFVGGG